jgi:hypothetical protein
MLEEVGIPREMWADPDMWVSFLRIARAARELSAEELSLLAERAEACVIETDA